MNLFRKPKPRRAHRRTKTWLDKHPEYAEELLPKVKNSPGFRAAIIKAATGIEFERDELEMMDPQSFFALKALLAKKLGLDKRLPFSFDDNSFFNAFAPDRSRTHRQTRHANFAQDDSFPDLSPLSSDDAREEYQRYRQVFAPRRPLGLRHRRPRLLMANKPPVSRQDQQIVDLIKAFNEAVKERTAPPGSSPKVYALEVNDELVEMNEEQYRDFCRERDEKRRLIENTPSQPANGENAGISEIPPPGGMLGTKPEQGNPPAKSSSPQASN